MYTRKNFTLWGILLFSWHHIVWLALYASTITVLYEVNHSEWMAIPWLPISVIGTAVAFYVGFKNNSAYDRLWEARKIWGSIVNGSRMWGSMVKNYVGNQFRETDMDEASLYKLRKKMIYRHIAWLYTLRSQLLVPTQWEHLGGSKVMRDFTQRRQKRFGTGLFHDQITEIELEKHLEKDEMEEYIEFKNTATQLLDRQGAELSALRKMNLIDDFRHMELQNIINGFYTDQGKCERIKNYPLPRQYGSMSFVFVALFIFLLPFGMIPQFHDLGDHNVWLAIPFTVLVGWVFIVMELIGDYSENPFEGLGNDIPMLALSRTIEIDLMEMLGETDLPEKIKPVNDVLM
jgi:putative membrane protein